MSFLRRLFGNSESRPSGDADGFFVYVLCDRCGDRLRLRVHAQQELNRTDQGYVWHKTIIDNRCFRPMPTVIHFDANYKVQTADIEGGRLISQAEYEALEINEATDTDEPGE